MDEKKFGNALVVISHEDLFLLRLSALHQFHYLEVRQGNKIKSNHLYYFFIDVFLYRREGVLALQLT